MDPEREGSCRPDAGRGRRRAGGAHGERRSTTLIAHELCIAVDGNQRVDQRFAEWVGRQLTVAQAPVEMDFGYTLVVLDPDRHRLRVFAPGPH